MANHTFYQPLVVPDGTAAGHTATKGQLDTAVADAKNLANSTGTLPVARIADGSITTVKISGFQSAVDARVATLVDASSAALDTFREIATAINNDPNFSATIQGQFTALGTRVTNLENAGPPGPTSINVPALSGAAVTITHGKGRRVLCQVVEVSTGQIVNPVVTGNGASSNTLSLDFGSLSAASGAFVALVY